MTEMTDQDKIKYLLENGYYMSKFKQGTNGWYIYFVYVKRGIPLEGNEYILYTEGKEVAEMAYNLLRG